MNAAAKIPHIIDPTAPEDLDLGKLIIIINNNNVYFLLFVLFFFYNILIKEDWMPIMYLGHEHGQAHIILESGDNK